VMVIEPRTQGSGRNYVPLTRRLLLANCPPLAPSQLDRISRNVNPVATRATRSPWGKVRCDCDTTAVNRHAIFIGRRLATLGSVKTATYGIYCISIEPRPRTQTDPTLVAFIFFRSIPTSRVTPSPKRRLDAATCVGGLA
jgi:hypothetical protein